MKPPNVTTSILFPVLLWLWRFLLRRAFNLLAILSLTGLLVEAFRLAAAKLPIETTFMTRQIGS